MTIFDAIIFDFDGVLFDSESLHFQACKLALERYQIKLNESTYDEKYVGLSDQELLPLILSREGCPLEVNDINNIIKMKWDEYRNLIDKSPQLFLKNGLKNVLDELVKANKKIAICSGATREEIEMILSRLENGKILSYFESIVTIEDVDRGKPSPQGYQLTSKRLGISPDRCLVVEDSLNGIRAAKSAGMFVVGLVGTLAQANLKEADKIIYQLPELLKLIMPEGRSTYTSEHHEYTQ